MAREQYVSEAPLSQMLNRCQYDKYVRGGESSNLAKRKAFCIRKNRYEFKRANRKSIDFYIFNQKFSLVQFFIE